MIRCYSNAHQSWRVTCMHFRHCRSCRKAPAYNPSRLCRLSRTRPSIGHKVAEILNSWPNSHGPAGGPRGDTPPRSRQVGGCLFLYLRPPGRPDSRATSDRASRPYRSRSEASRLSLRSRNTGTGFPSARGTMKDTSSKSQRAKNLNRRLSEVFLRSPAGGFQLPP